MKIVIAGAGSVGFHLATLMAAEAQDIVLIDTDAELLDQAANSLDVFTLKGDISSIEILEIANVGRSDLFIAVTTAETTNLLAAILAKKLGAKKTIARVSNPEYLEKEEKKNFQELGVDVVISPIQLAAQEIQRLLQRCSFTDIYEFEKDKLSLIGFTVDTNSPMVNHTMKAWDEATPNFPFRAVAILRNQKTIIPRGNTLIKRSDHLYLMTENKYIDVANQYIGKQQKNVRNVMITGGSPLALRTAQLIENEYSVSIVEPDKEQCKMLTDKLHNTLIVKGDSSNIDLLKEEGLEEMDAFVALTPNSEINIVNSLMAEQAGVYKTIASVDNPVYIHISQNIGVDTLINKKLIAANNIFRYIRKGNIEAITSLHGVDAEIIKFNIKKSKRLVKHPIRDLHLPSQVVIAGVIRGEQNYIPDGDFQIQLHDKVIVFVLPEAIAKVEELFR